MSQNDWWKPKNLEESERKFQKDPQAGSHIGGDFHSYKALREGSSIAKSMIDEHNVTKRLALDCIIRDYVRILKMEKLIKYEKIADLGCGAGFTTAALKRAIPNAEATGFDISRDAIFYAREHNKECNFQKITITHESKLGKFDIIIAQEFYPFTRTDSLSEHEKWINFIRNNLAEEGIGLIAVTQMNNNSINVNYKELRKKFRIALTRIMSPRISRKLGFYLSNLVAEVTHKIYPQGTKCIYKIRK